MQGVFIKLTLFDRVDLSTLETVYVSVDAILTLKPEISSDSSYDSTTGKWKKVTPTPYTLVKLEGNKEMFVAESPEEIQNLIPKAQIEANARYVEAQMLHNWKERKGND